MQQAIDLLPAIAERVAALGVEVVHRVFATSRRPSVHVMFNRHGQRIADYWPGTGTIRMAGQKRQVESVDEALAVALDALNVSAPTTAQENII